MNKFLPLMLCLLLAACSPNYLTPEEMSPAAGIYTQLPENPSLKNAIKLGVVQVAKKVEEALNPVNVENYTKTLQNVLSKAGFASPSHEAPRYILNASFLDLDYGGWFSKDGTSKARYILKRIDTNTVVLDETLTLFSHVPYSLFVDAAVRIRLSMALACQENMTHLIRLLAATPLPL